MLLSDQSIQLSVFIFSCSLAKNRAAPGSRPAQPGTNRSSFHGIRKIVVELLTQCRLLDLVPRQFLRLRRRRQGIATAVESDPAHDVEVGTLPTAILRVHEYVAERNHSADLRALVLVHPRYFVGDLAAAHATADRRGRKRASIKRV